MREKWVTHGLDKGPKNYKNMLSCSLKITLNKTTVAARLRGLWTIAP